MMREWFGGQHCGCHQVACSAPVATSRRFSGSGKRASACQKRQMQLEDAGLKGAHSIALVAGGCLAGIYRLQEMEACLGACSLIISGDVC